jgi:hypothetical protein
MLIAIQFGAPVFPSGINKCKFLLLLCMGSHSDLPVKGKNSLRAHENKVPRRMIGPEKDGVAKGGEGN